MLDELIRGLVQDDARPAVLATRRSGQAVVGATRAELGRLVTGYAAALHGRGLVAGDTVGLAVRPEGVSWGQLAGVATVAGIGFTVPLFVADLAFPDGRFQAPVKLGLLLASVIAGVAGALALMLAARRRDAGA